MKITVIADTSKYLAHLISQARAQSTGTYEFRAIIRQIGTIFGYEISKSLDYEHVEILTAMSAVHTGTKLCTPVLIMSSFEDSGYFAAGLRDVFPAALTGKIDAYRTFTEGRWRAPVQRAELPLTVPDNSLVIIAKSVLASGCTAISLIGKTLEVAKPSSVTVAAIIAHQDAFQEIAKEYPYISINFMVGEIDPVLDNSGYVVPGIGNVSARLAEPRT